LVYKTYNYTKIRKREKRIYSIAGTKISSSGLKTSFLQTAGVCFAVFNVVGVLICVFTGEFLYNPIKSATDFSLTFPMVFLVGPFALAAALNSLKVQNYKLVEFLMIYFKPKYTYDHNGRVVRFSKVGTDCLVEKVL